jgi:predicted O-methyltransferase YrrM
MNINRALSIEGNSLPAEELTWLAVQAEKHVNIVEIGSNRGRSATAMSDNTGGSVTAVDVWEDSDALDAFRQNMGDNVFPYRMTSLTAAAMFAEQGKTFDMIFIDASHDYENVKADILAWRPLLDAGGLICGHDYGRESVVGGGQYDVTRVVDELFPLHKVEVTGSIWAVTL